MESFTPGRLIPLCDLSRPPLTTLVLTLPPEIFSTFSWMTPSSRRMSHPGWDVLGKKIVGRGHPLCRADHLFRRQREGGSFFQLYAGLVRNLAGPDLGAGEILKAGNGPPEALRDRAHVLEALLVLFLGAVRKIEAHHVEASLDEGARGVLGSWEAGPSVATILVRRMSVLRTSIADLLRLLFPGAGAVLGRFLETKAGGYSPALSVY